MKQVNFNLDDKVYQYFKELFNGNEKAMNEFAVKTLTDEIIKNYAHNNKKDLEVFLKSGKLGSRTYGTKGQGW